MNRRKQGGKRTYRLTADYRYFRERAPNADFPAFVALEARQGVGPLTSQVIDTTVQRQGTSLVSGNVHHASRPTFADNWGPHAQKSRPKTGFRASRYRKLLPSSRPGWTQVKHGSLQSPTALNLLGTPNKLKPSAGHKRTSRIQSAQLFAKRSFQTHSGVHFL